MNIHPFADDEADENEFYDEYERAAQNAHGIVGDEDDYGACPLCGGAGEAVARGRHHWLVCHRDRVKWRIGTGLFGSGLLGWITGGRGKWDRVGDWFDEYREVAPETFPAPQSATPQSATPQSANPQSANPQSANPQSAAPLLSLVPGKVADETDEHAVDIDDESEEVVRFKRMFE